MTTSAPTIDANDGHSAVTPQLTRRRFLAWGAALTGAPMLALAPRARAASIARSLAFEHTHTGERLAITYAQGDRYVPEGIAAVERLLRDFRTGEQHAIDPALLDQLHTLAQITGTRTAFQVISGYRSPGTNQKLRAASRGVASHSLHLEGRAIDVRLADVPLADLRDAALSLRAGGVGYYASPQFVHVDTGRVRRW